MAEYARNWCADVQRASGHTPVVYTFLSFAEEGNCAGLGHYPLWIAEPSAPAGRPVVPKPWSTWKFHQYGTTRVGTNTVDVNVFNGDTAALKQFANPAPKPKEETEVQSGSLNNGASAVTAIAIPFGSATGDRLRLRQRETGAAHRQAAGGGLERPLDGAQLRGGGQHQGPDRAQIRRPVPDVGGLGRSVSTPATSASGTWSPKLPV